MPASTNSERMAAITAARQSLREAKETAEARLKEQLRIELLQHSTVLDLRIREAVEAGDRVSDVMRAYPTRDRHTILHARLHQLRTNGSHHGRSTVPA